MTMNSHPGNGRLNDRNGLMGLSFDVEEWFQTAAVTAVSAPGAFDGKRRRSPFLVDALVRFLGERGARATFFVLGDLLRAEPGIADSILESGHELACHGWGHRSLKEMDRKSFREDIEKCFFFWDLLSLSRPSGYRAPSFSVTEGNSAWVAEELSSNGFVYDSSVFPVALMRYGIDNSPISPYELGDGGRTVIELPLAVSSFMGLRIPVAGGAWMRFTPLHLHLRLLRRAVRSGLVPVIYSHPWEYDEPFDGESGFSPVVRLRQGRGSGKRMWKALGRLLDRFESLPLMEIASAYPERPEPRKR